MEREIQKVPGSLLVQLELDFSMDKDFLLVKSEGKVIDFAAVKKSICKQDNLKNLNSDRLIELRINSLLAKYK